MEGDVLYLQLLAKRGQEMFGEDTENGLYLMRTADGEACGLTIVSWWKRFGKGKVESATLETLSHRVQESARALYSAA